MNVTGYTLSNVLQLLAESADAAHEVAVKSQFDGIEACFASAEVDADGAVDDLLAGLFAFLDLLQFVIKVSDPFL